MLWLVACCGPAEQSGCSHASLITNITACCNNNATDRLRRSCKWFEFANVYSLHSTISKSVYIVTFILTAFITFWLIVLVRRISDVSFLMASPPTVSEYSDFINRTLSQIEISANVTIYGRDIFCCSRQVRLTIYARNRCLHGSYAEDASIW